MGGNNENRVRDGGPGTTLEVTSMDYGNTSSAKRGPKKIRKEVEGGEEIYEQAKGTVQHCVQTKDNDGPFGTRRSSVDGPPGRRRSSLLSIKDFNLDGVDDGTRMSFGNMSAMSDMTDFQEMMMRRP